MHAVGVVWKHVCALLEGGAVRCWGNNSFSQLGDNRYGQLGYGHVHPVGMTMPMNT